MTDKELLEEWRIRESKAEWPNEFIAKLLAAATASERARVIGILESMMQPNIITERNKLLSEAINQIKDEMPD